ncbi:MAG: hypothetical protein AAF990_08895 [Bacteroidota bacterium]
MERLLLLLSSLEKSELSKFKAFLNSPFYNTNPFLSILFAYLRKFYPSFKGSKLELEQIRKRLLSDKAYHPTYLEDRISELARLLEEFLMVRQVQTDQTLRTEVKWQTFKSRNLHAQTLKVRSDIYQTIEEEPASEWADSFSKWHWANRLYCDLESETPKHPAPQIGKIMEWLDEHYLIHKLSYICELLSRQKTFQENHSIRLFDAVLREAEKRQKDHPKIYIYYQLIKMFQADFPEEVFQSVDQLFRDNYQELSLFEQRLLLYKLCGIASSQLMEGQKINYGKKGFDLYKFGVEKGILLIDGKIKEKTFINICILGATSNAYEWTKNFIHFKSLVLLPLKTIEETKLIGNTYFLFHLGKFEEANELLIDFPTKSVTLRYRINTLSIRCYMELFLRDSSYQDILAAKIRSFKKFISRNKRYSKARKKSYTNFIEAVSLLLKYRKNRSFTKSELAEAIEECKPVISPKWISTKVKTISKRRSP